MPIYLGKEVRVGRDKEKWYVFCSSLGCKLLKRGSPFVLRDDTVSKQHFRIYSIIYDDEKLDEVPPLIYCEDLESTNGTYVNDACIGIMSRERIGHLLSDGDIIEIKPNLRFRFHQPVHQPEFRTKEQFDDLEVGVDSRLLKIPCLITTSNSRIFSTSRLALLVKAPMVRYI
jgi:hypothetical protein